MIEQINIRLPDPLGDTIMSTTVIQSVRSTFPDADIHVYTKHPDLMWRVKAIDQIHVVPEQERASYDINLLNYVENGHPLESEPFRHLIIHQFEIAERQVSRAKKEVSLSRYLLPQIHLAQRERDNAFLTYDRLSRGAPVVWLQTKTSTIAKDWTDAGWNKVERLSPNCRFVNLRDYKVREAIALIAVCDAGVTLDTFALHGAAAVGAQNVIGVMIRSPWQVVGYPGQTCVSGLDDDAPQKIAKLLEEAVTEPDGKKARELRRQVFISPHSSWG